MPVVSPTVQPVIAMPLLSAEIVFREIVLPCDEKTRMPAPVPLLGSPV